MPPKTHRRQLPLQKSRPIPKPIPIPRKRPRKDQQSKPINNEIKQAPETKEKTDFASQNRKKAAKTSVPAVTQENINKEDVVALEQEVKPAVMLQSESKPVDLERNMCPEDLLSTRMGLVFSVLSLLPHADAIKHFFQYLFGIDKNEVKEGLVIDDYDCDLFARFHLFKNLWKSVEGY